MAHQTPLSMEFPWQEYWRGLPFPSPGHLPDLGIEPMSLASSALAGSFFTTAPSGKPINVLTGPLEKQALSLNRVLMVCNMQTSARWEYLAMVKRAHQL